MRNGVPIFRLPREVWETEIDAILELSSRSKDEGYRSRLDGYPVPRLYDLLQSSKKRAGKKAAASVLAPATTSRSRLALRRSRRR